MSLSGRTRTRQRCPDFRCPCSPKYDSKKKLQYFLDPSSTVWPTDFKCSFDFLCFFWLIFLPKFVPFLQHLLNSYEPKVENDRLFVWRSKKLNEYHPIFHEYKTLLIVFWIRKIFQTSQNEQNHFHDLVARSFQLKNLLSHTTTLIKTFLLSSYATKLSMRNYIEQSQEGNVPNTACSKNKNFISFFYKTGAKLGDIFDFDIHYQEDLNFVTNILRLSLTSCHGTFERNSKGCFKSKTIPNESFHELLLCY